MQKKFAFTKLSYFSFYLKDYEKAIEFYTGILGEPPKPYPNEALTGWPIGSTWLTFFPAKGGTDPNRNPCNSEFAIEVETPEEVDRLHSAFVEAGAKDVWTPEDTEMYVPMRFSAVDDPFGIRIDIICPLK